MGESVMEGKILQWLKKEGDAVEQDESVLEVATDKVDTEVPATHSGILQKILAHEGDTVEVGKPIAIIAQNNGVSTEEALPPEPSPDTASEETADSKNEPQIPVAVTGRTDPPQEASARFYSPLVMNIAKKENISMEALAQIAGTGKEGRVTKKDILQYVKSRPTAEPNTSPTPSPSSVPTPEQPTKRQPQDEIIEMDRMRQMIATRMLDSTRISAHVTSFVEADVTGIVLWRNRVKQIFEEREGEKLTFTPIFMEAVAKALKDYPMINVSVDGNNIIKHKGINIGMAVALPSGNLIVPVIKNADQLSLTGLTKQVNALSARARDNKLTADDLAGGTYTVSNIGSFGNLMGTPIIMQPQVAILALGAIVKKPSVVETPTGDALAIRHKMYLSHSYDHRVVDGALGGMFVRRVADYLEAFSVDRDLY